MTTKRSVATMALCGIAVFALSFAITSVAMAESTRPPVAPPTHLAQEDFGPWRYAAYREGEQVMLQVSLKDTSPNGLEAFRVANRKLALELVKEVQAMAVNVVLAQPLPAAEFIDMASRYGLEVNAFQMRLIDGRGDRVTIFGAPEDGEVVVESALQSMQNWIESQTGAARLLGVISIQARLAASQYDDISGDPLVFVVDVTPEVAQRHMRERHGDLLDSNDLISVPNYPLYWYLEENRMTGP